MDNLCNCLFCDPQKKRSEEHIIPDAIGGKIKIYTVCKECNEKLGEQVDYQLYNDDIIKFLIVCTGTKNRDNKVVDIYNSKYGWKDKYQEPVILKRGIPTQEYCLYDGTENPEVSIEVSPDKKKLNIKYKGSDYGSIIIKTKRELKKYGLDYSEEDIRKLLPIEKMNITSEMTEAHHDLIINFEHYIPCIFKIAYEICAKELGEIFLNDPCAIRIKEYLCKVMNKKTNQIPIDLLLHYSFDYTKISNKHIIRISQCEGQIVVEIRLYGCLFFKVVVSNNSKLYSDKMISDIIYNNYVN